VRADVGEFGLGLGGMAFGAFALLALAAACARFVTLACLGCQRGRPGAQPVAAPLTFSSRMQSTGQTGMHSSQPVQ
jgi:hypothetical protein